MQEFAKLFKALGNEKRAKILLLLKSGDRLPVKEIAKRVGMSLKAASKHLIFFDHHSILDKKRKGETVLYFRTETPSKIGRIIYKILDEF